MHSQPWFSIFLPMDTQVHFPYLPFRVHTTVILLQTEVRLWFLWISVVLKHTCMGKWTTVARALNVISKANVTNLPEVTAHNGTVKIKVLNFVKYYTCLLILQYTSYIRKSKTLLQSDLWSSLKLSNISASSILCVFLPLFLIFSLPGEIPTSLLYFRSFSKYHLIFKAFIDILI